jgi:non-ribosomal peptide synthetase component F
LQYTDFAAWQRRVLEPRWNRHVGYWLDRLRDRSVSQELPIDRPRPKRPGSAGGEVAVGVPAAVAKKLAAIAKAEGATMFMVCLAAYAAMLARASGRPEVVIATHVVGRPRPELQSVAGYFGNTVLMPQIVESGMSFRALLRSVRTHAVEAMAHGDLPFDVLVDRLRIRRPAGEAPVANAMLAYHEEPRQPVVLSEVTFEPLTMPRRTAKAELVLEIGSSENGVQGVFEYRTQIFDRETVARLARQWEDVLTRAADQPDAPLWTDVPEEAALTGIWCEVLGRAAVDTSADFFDAGGNSLMAAQVVTRVQEQLGVRVPLRWCFDAPTIERLASAVRALGPGGDPTGLLAELEWEEPADA